MFVCVYQKKAISITKIHKQKLFSEIASLKRSKL